MYAKLESRTIKLTKCFFFIKNLGYSEITGKEKVNKSDEFNNPPGPM